MWWNLVQVNLLSSTDDAFVSYQSSNSSVWRTRYMYGGTAVRRYWLSWIHLLDVLVCLTSSCQFLCLWLDHRALPVQAEQTAEPSDDTQNTKWLANIEIYTHEPPARRLWMGPQFKFKTYKTPQDGGGLSAEEEVADLFGTGGAMLRTAGDDSPVDPSSLDLLSLNMQQSSVASSAPIATPHRSSHLQCRETDIVLDAGPCSLDKTQLEICSSSPSDREKYTNRELNEKLEKNLADAMEDLDLSPGSGNIDISSGLPTVASVTVTPAPGPSFHSSSAPHHAMPSPPRSNRRVDTNPTLKWCCLFCRKDSWVFVVLLCDNPLCIVCI